MSKTAMQKMIEAVEKGYHNTSSWGEWKATLLEDEKEQLRHAFLCGDNAVFHFNRPEDFKTFVEYYTQTFTQ